MPRKRRSNTASTHDPLEGFPRFCAEVRARLEAGRAHYADESFTRPLHGLVQEIRQELLDVAGWAYVAAVRLEALERTARQAEGGTEWP